MQGGYGQEAGRPAPCRSRTVRDNESTLGFEGSLRYVHVGDRPANEAGSVTAEGYTVFTLTAAYRTGRVKPHLILENLFDVEWNEAQFDTASRLASEQSEGSVIY